MLITWNDWNVTNQCQWPDPDYILHTMDTEKKNDLINMIYTQHTHRMSYRICICNDMVYTQRGTRSDFIYHCLDPTMVISNLTLLPLEGPHALFWNSPP